MLISKFKMLFSVFAMCLLSSFVIADDDEEKKEGLVQKVKITVGDVNCNHENIKSFSHKIVIKNKDGEVIDLSDEMSQQVKNAIKLKLNVKDGAFILKQGSNLTFIGSNKLTEEKFKQLDVDENENLDQDEFLAYVKNYFDSLDKDGDELISKEEYPVSNFKLSTVTKDEVTISKYFSFGDKKELFISGKAKANDSDFVILDQDKDESIDYDEFSSGSVQAFKSLDKDGDHYISKEERK